MSKKVDVWMPLFIGDYLGDTGRLTTEQHGAYFLLIMDYWRAGPPPDDDRALAAIAKLSLARWKRHRLTLARFFKVTEGVWRHKRIDADLVKWSEKRANFESRARAGGLAKAAKSKSQATLNGCTSPSSLKEEPLKGSSLQGRKSPVSPRKERPAIPPEEREKVGKLMRGLADELAGRAPLAAA